MEALTDAALQGLVAAATGLAAGVLAGAYLGVFYAGAGALRRAPVGGPLLATGHGSLVGSADAIRWSQRGVLRRLLLPLAAGLLFALASVTSESGAEAALKGWLGLPFLLATATDLERRLIPNRLVLAFLLLALALSWAWPERGPVAAPAGAALGFGLLSIPYLLSAGGLGAGDVKFAALMGAVLGPASVVLALLVGVTAGGVAALALLAARRSRQQTMPYGPFLAAGGLVALLWGEGLIAWYLG